MKAAVRWKPFPEAARIIESGLVIVEGQTEESFVSGPLAEALALRQVYLTPIILGVPGHKGGRTNYDRVRKDILKQLKQDRQAYCTTMLDFYGLGPGFPGRPAPASLSSLAKVQRVERAIRDDICSQVPDLRPAVRFIPYLSLHEYEGLLFSDPEALAQSIGQPNFASSLHEIRSAFPTPEDIDDSPEMAPSKRIKDVYRAYRKVIEGTQAARAVGIPKMREECPQFRDWLERLENLPLL